LWFGENALKRESHPESNAIIWVMNLIYYDGTFAGFLTAIFEIYERKLVDVKITRFGIQRRAFARELKVITDRDKAKRVWTGLMRITSAETCKAVYACFLSEIPMIEQVLMEFCKYAFDSRKDISRDFAHPAALQVEKISKKVYREKHRMEAFVRFSRLNDDLYFSEVEPDFNVLPLIGKHFKDRYADQDWMIYDKKRAYGIHFEKATGALTEIVLNFTDNPSNRQQDIFHDEEKLYQQLWKDYFHHVNIPARKNLKLHIQHVPTRYWKHLTEKFQL
jgi:probable DNA metabolism protein